MIVYSLVAATLAISILSCWLAWRSNKSFFRYSWPSLLLSVSLAAFIHFYGVWVFISVYCKYLADACFALLLVASLLRKKTPGSAGKRSLLLVNTLFTVFFSVLVVLYFTGTSGKPYGTVNLSIPFRTGTYFVFQGGKGLPTNVFHYSGRHTLFAMDIIKLNKEKARARHIFSRRLEDYEIFNDTICSPCRGKIVKTERTNPDNIPPLRRRGTTNLNYVLIETDSAYIFLGHLKQGSVFIKSGDRVVAGQPLGLAGNSGMSLEPHLHIQAHAKTGAGVPWYKEPQLLIKFEGKSYLLFEEIYAH